MPPENVVTKLRTLQILTILKQLYQDPVKNIKTATTTDANLPDEANKLLLATIEVPIKTEHFTAEQKLKLESTMIIDTAGLKRQTTNDFVRVHSDSMQGILVTSGDRISVLSRQNNDGSTSFEYQLSHQLDKAMGCIDRRYMNRFSPIKREEIPLAMS